MRSQNLDRVFSDTFSSRNVPQIECQKYDWVSVSPGQSMTKAVILTLG